MPAPKKKETYSQAMERLEKIVSQIDNNELEIDELDIRKKYGVNIMAIKHNDSINVNVEPDIVLTEDITLLVLGDYKNLKKCFKV